METYVVVPTHNRNEMVLTLLKSLALPADRVLIIDNASSPPVWPDPSVDPLNPPPPMATFLLDFEQPPNLSRMWNRGLDWAEKQAAGREYAVAILNDDVVLPPAFLDRMVEALRQTGAAAAFPDQHRRNLGLLHRTLPGPVPLHERMTGFAFVLRGGIGLRADERLRWWFGDDDLEWQALERGGTVLVGGVSVEHLHADESTRSRPELVAQTHRDRAVFIEKWGRAPW